MPADRPWRDRDALAALAAAWRRLAGRPVHHAAGGPGWAAVALAGQDRPRLQLVCRGGSSLAWSAEGPPPPDVAEALGRSRRHPLSGLLADAVLGGAGVLPDDLVLALAFDHPRRRSPLVLLQQLFGPRGNLVLLDGRARRLWSLHGDLHRVLTEAPPPATWAAGPGDAGVVAGDGGPAGTRGEAPVEAVFRAAALAHLRQALAAELAGRLGGAVRRQLAATSRLLEGLERDLAAADRGEEHRRAAETLAAHLHELRRGQAEVVLPAADGRGELHLRLDPALSPAGNLERRFHLARKAERGRRQVAERLADARRRQQELLAARRDLEAIVADPHGRLPRLLSWRRQHPGLSPRAARGRRPAPAEPLRPFRRYRIEGRWEVWVGRNAAENDELTHRASAPDDVWLHAQGVGGSHVVLRAGGHARDLPRRVLEKAAALAALHSRARHSALVPVVHTLRKYVRKPRRSPPGTASLLRGKTLFAAPGVPEGVEPI